MLNLKIQKMNLSLKFQNDSALGTNGLSYRVISIKLKKEHGVKQTQVPQHIAEDFTPYHDRFIAFIDKLIAEVDEFSEQD